MCWKVGGQSKGRCFRQRGSVNRGVQCEGTWDFCTAVRGAWLEQEVLCAKDICVQVIQFGLCSGDRNLQRK